MEDSRFDALSRLVGGGLSRRVVVRGAIATLLGGAALGLADPAAARALCREGGRQCTRHGQCCTGDCLRVSGGGRPRYICSCPRGLALCNNRCVNLDNDARNCGTCGKRCKSGESCCNGACVLLGTRDHCGACGDRCVGDASCISGACMSVCIEGPGIDACCNNAPTRLGTDSDCDDCGDACPAGESCYELPRNQDGSFAGASCCDCTGKCGDACDGECPACPPDQECDADDTCVPCDCTDRCGTYCDGSCPPCPSGETCDEETDTCVAGLVCAVADATYRSTLSTDTPRLVIPLPTRDHKVNVYAYYSPNDLDLTGAAPCTVSSDCTANCPATTLNGRTILQCICRAYTCDSNLDPAPSHHIGQNLGSGAANDKYYCAAVWVE